MRTSKEVVGVAVSVDEARGVMLSPVTMRLSYVTSLTLSHALARCMGALNTVLFSFDLYDSQKQQDNGQLRRHHRINRNLLT